MKTHKKRAAVVPVIEQLCIYKKVVELPEDMLDRLGASRALLGSIHMAAYSCLEAVDGEAVVVVDGNPLRGADMSFTYLAKADTNSVG